jgi:hypothetical protein
MIDSIKNITQMSKINTFVGTDHTQSSQSSSYVTEIKKYFVYIVKTIWSAKLVRVFTIGPCGCNIVWIWVYFISAIIYIIN